jgi:hypothetical protein
MQARSTLAAITCPSPMPSDCRLGENALVTIGLEAPATLPVPSQPVKGQIWVHVQSMASSTTFDPRQDPPKIGGDLQDVARGVHEEFDELLDPATVDASLERVSATFAHAKFRGFVPLLVRRYVSDDLHKRIELA